MHLILASSSPYRAELLRRLRLDFTAISPDVDETPQPGETPHDLAIRLSISKAHTVAHQHPGSLVIGSDQVATLNGQALGKPGTHERAVAQLQQMSGQAVDFHSALCVHNGQQHKVANVITRCVFRSLSDDEIHTYLHLEQPYDTAGSAKAEGLGISLMAAMHSDDPTAIIGLPLITLSTMLRHFGLNPLTHSTPPGRPS